MVKATTRHEEVVSQYAKAVERVQECIREADTIAFSKPLHLKELAKEIDELSQSIGYEEGKAYTQFYTGRAFYKQAEFEQALAHYHAALELFTYRHNTHCIVMCLHHLGLSYQSLSRYAEALEYFQRELEVVQQPYSSEEQRVPMVYASIASVYLLTGHYDIALQQFMGALKLLEERDDDDIRAGTLHNIATIYTLLDDSEQGMEYFQKALKVWQECGDKAAETNTLLNIVWNLLRLERYQQALENGFTVLQLCRELDDRKREAVVLLHIGQAYTKLQQFEEAFSFLNQGYALAFDIGDRRNSADIVQALGALFVALGNKKQAKEQYEKALSIMREIGARQDEYEICGILATMAKGEGDMEQALLYYEEYMRVKEEVLDESRRTAISELQVRFNVEQAQKEKEMYRLKNVELAEALEKVKVLNQHLLDANTEKSELLGIVAHDLKNPLAGLSMALTLVDRFREQLSPQNIDKHITQMAATVQRMEHIVARLLETNRLEAGELPLSMTVCDFRDIVRGVAQEYQQRGQQKHIVVELNAPEYPLHIYADRDATIEIVENVVSNAIKYSAQHSVVTVYLEVRGTMVVCEVQDRGAGISAADMAKLFKKFSRVGNRPTGGESSTGLGLWIVKKLVESMGGSVECESELGKGSTFRVLLPVVSMEEVAGE